MGLKCKIRLLCLIAVLTLASSTAEELDLDDSIVIEAATGWSKRDSRQITVRGTDDFQYNPFLVNANAVNPPPLATTGPCFNNKGVLGKCSPFRSCYPADPQAPGTFESWISGMSDTCSYFTAQGRQMFGVCCTAADPVHPATSTDHPEEATAPSPSNSSKQASPYYPQIANWPPPIPTHPPDHTIPPLPTHPPSHGFPTLPPASYPTFPPSYPTLPPVSYPTQPTPAKPTAWPPIVGQPWPPVVSQPTRPPVTPTRPPYKPPSATPAPVASGSCGIKNGYQDQERIVGGQNADVGEWPWIAALFNGGRQFCGGSLIDNIHILSAAHCVAHMSSWDVARLTVRLGDHNIKTPTETKHIEKRVKRVVRHRHFDSRTLYNDIAILTLDEPVQFTNVIRPICLPNTGKSYAGQMATVIGWGSLRESGPQPAVLQEVNIPIWSNQQCQVKYGPAAPGGIVEHMLCAGKAAKDSCSGDSGGPLMVNDGKWVQVGVVSWGIGCGKGQYPGVYTRVEKFMPWITKNSRNS